MAFRRSAKELLKWRTIQAIESIGPGSAIESSVATRGVASGNFSESGSLGSSEAVLVSAADSRTKIHTSSWLLAAAGIATTCAASSVHAASPAAAETAAASSQKTPSLEKALTPRVVFVLGGPGSGKGTQCAKIVDEFGFTHLSAGDLLRAEIKSGSAHGTMIQNMIKEGKIVPAEVTVGLLQKAMKDSGNDKFLIDGFPRNDDNRLVFERDTGIDPEFILFFDCPEEVMEKRLLNRNQGRIDDNIETIRKRFRVFLDQSIPVVSHYEERGKVKRVNAARSPDDVFKSISPAFLPFLEDDLLSTNASLLAAIDSGDFASYSKLCDPGLTAFEPEAQGHLVEGIPFHEFYFKAGAAAAEGVSSGEGTSAPAAALSTMVNPRVSIVGNMGVVTYTRLKQVAAKRSSEEGGVTVEAANETRVWERTKGGSGEWGWKNMHFHRSHAPLFQEA